MLNPTKTQYTGHSLIHFKVVSDIGKRQTGFTN